MIRHYFPFLAALVLLILSSALKAQDFVYWIGTHSNEWQNPANWREGQLPGATDVVILNNTAVRPLEITTTVNLAGLQISSQNVTVAASGRLNIYGSIDVSAGSLINNGYIDTDGHDAPHSFKIAYEGRLLNNGYIRVGSVANIAFAINNTTETFVNNEGATFELASAGLGFRIYTTEQAEFINRGKIIYSRSSLLLNLSDVTKVTFTNSGRIEATGEGILNGADNRIINDACGVIDLKGTGHFDNAGGTTSNAGLLLIKGNLGNEHVFTNTGVVRAAGYAPYTNRGLQINNAPATPAFEYGANNIYEVKGIYKDSSDNYSAGTFTPPNDFRRNSTQADLYARVENGTCAFYVPFLSDLSALPVAWIGFEGAANDEGVHLTWSTAQETRNHGFEIYRSSDTRSWVKTGFVNATETDGPEEQRHRSYTYLDASAPGGIFFYRLRQVDHDGNYSDSKIISVQTQGENALMLYPNPAAEWLKVQLPGNKRPTSFRVLDGQGKVLYNKLPMSGKLNLSGLPAGKYYVEIVSHEGFRSMRAFVKE